MDRLDYFFKQIVAEDELDLGFDQVQARIESGISLTEQDGSGMVQGGDVTESSPQALTVEVSGNAFGFSKLGEQLRWTPAETVDASIDDVGSPTTVTTPGNSRIVSVFVEFDEDLQDPRIDGFGSPVFFKVIADKRLFVLQGAEAVSPVAPTLQTDALLLADITLIFGQTVIADADISVSRREDYFRRTGTNSIIRGRTKEVLEDLLDFHNTLEDGLAQQTAPSGATLVGIEAFTATPTSGTALDYGDDTVRGAVNDLIGDLTGATGASKLGSGPKTGSIVSLPVPLSLVDANINSHLQTLLDYSESIRNTPVAAAAVAYAGQTGAASLDLPIFTSTEPNVEDALDFLLLEINKRVKRAGGVFDGGGTGGTGTAIGVDALGGLGATGVKGTGESDGFGVHGIGGGDDVPGVFGEGTAAGGSGDGVSGIGGLGDGFTGVRGTGLDTIEATTDGADGVIGVGGSTAFDTSVAGDGVIGTGGTATGSSGSIGGIGVVGTGGPGTNGDGAGVEGTGGGAAPGVKGIALTSADGVEGTSATGSGVKGSGGVGVEGIGGTGVSGTGTTSAGSAGVRGSSPTGIDNFGIVGTLGATPGTGLAAAIKGIGSTDAYGVVAEGAGLRSAYRAIPDTADPLVVDSQEGDYYYNSASRLWRQFVGPGNPVSAWQNFGTFGATVLVAESLGITLTTATGGVFANKVSLSTPSDLPLGDYLLLWSFGWAVESAGGRIQVRIQEDNTGGALGSPPNTNLMDMTEEPADTSGSPDVWGGLLTANIYRAGGQISLAARSGAHTYDLDFNQDGGAVEVGLAEARLILTRAR